MPYDDGPTYTDPIGLFETPPEGVWQRGKDMLLIGDGERGVRQVRAARLIGDREAADIALARLVTLIRPISKIAKNTKLDVGERMAATNALTNIYRATGQMAALNKQAILGDGSAITEEQAAKVIEILRKADQPKAVEAQPSSLDAAATSPAGPVLDPAAERRKRLAQAMLKHKIKR